jgi:long-chain acyl-CoA synthetase
MNLAEEIFRDADPDAMAMLWHGGEMTYGELDEKSRAIASRLREKIPAPGSRIGLRCPDGPGYVILALGILRAGCCLVPLALELTPAEQKSLTAKISLATVMIPDDSPGSHGFSLEPGGHPDPNLDQKLTGMEPAFIRFSSGTTGSAKGILLTHRSLADRITAANSGLGISASDRVLWTLPMSHHFVVSILLYLRHGAAVVFPESLLPGDLLRAAREHSATVFYASPLQYLLLVSGTSSPASEAATHWPFLRLAVSSTAPLDVGTARKFHAVYGVMPAQALGVMEVGLPLINLPHPELRPASVGKPQSGFEIQVRDETGSPCQAGTTGQLFLRGPGLFDAYVVPWKNREEIIGNGGWFATGDIAAIDGEGFVTLHGRTVNVISVGGMKFFPEEVEEVLCSQPGIREARVYATDHPAFGSVPVAEVVAMPGAAIVIADLLQSCRKSVARYKMPVEIRIVDSIPKTPSGKIRRK